MLSIFISTMFFSIDHQSTSNDRLKPVLTTGLVNMHIDRSIANLVFEGQGQGHRINKFTLHERFSPIF